MNWRRHHHGGPPKEGWPTAWYVRGFLRRRLFVWFGATIAVTAVTILAVMALTSPWAGWRRQANGLERFVDGRFANVWDDAAAREELAASITASFGVGVELAGVDGARIGGTATCRGKD